MARPKILVTNDDSIYSNGIKALVSVLSDLGDITVVAPKLPQSGMGHAITLNQPLRIKKLNLFNNVVAYECSGTPADCVKFAKAVIYKDPPDICVSGINHGSNSSINVIYSGTMSAAMEAAIEGINAIGFSLLSWDEEANMTTAMHYARQITEKVINSNKKNGLLLNVNIPNIELDNVRGVKVVRQSDAKWVEEYEKRCDPMGNEYYWLKGDFVNFDKGEDTDEHALKNAYVSVVPIKFDLTAYENIKVINEILNS
jgi:5'-nucleotidase